MNNAQLIPTPEELQEFKALIDKYRYDFCRLAFIIFDFGNPENEEMKDIKPYKWHMEEWHKMSKHYSNPATKDTPYRLIISSGNGAAKTAFGAMTAVMLMFTHEIHLRLTSNTEKQNLTVVWPEYGVWFNRARFAHHFFDYQGTSLKAKDETKTKWRIDAVTWSVDNPASISGLHNKGRHKGVGYIFEEAAGIPAKIWEYTSGAMTDTDTLKIFLAFANSDDPNSKFEQNMQSEDWHARRIDTRTLDHVSKDQIAVWLRECNGNEDHDEFRVRVRGLPRKSARDSIINKEQVLAAFERGVNFDMAQVAHLPSLITVDPAWTGGDEYSIWHHQGHVSTFLEAFKLEKERQDDHRKAYNKIVTYEKELKADAVLIDQAEGTALKTLANIDEKFWWILVSFAGSPNDAMDKKDSEYHNMRAQMYYEAAKAMPEQVLRSLHPERNEEIATQLSMAKGTRSNVTLKKLVESKDDIKERLGKSPDLGDGYVLKYSHKILDRRPENTEEGEEGDSLMMETREPMYG